MMEAGGYLKKKSNNFVEITSCIHCFYIPITHTPLTLIPYVGCYLGSMVPSILAELKVATY